MFTRYVSIRTKKITGVGIALSKTEVTNNLIGLSLSIGGELAVL